MVVFAVMAAALVLVSIPTAAQAHDGRGTSCVDKHEWKHARDGVRMRRVHRIFDTKGQVTNHFGWGGEVDTVREYRSCRPRRTGRWLEIWYDNYSLLPWRSGFRISMKEFVPAWEW